METTQAVFASLAPLGRNVAVIRVDESGLIAVAKPPGMLSHPNKSGEESRALLNASYELNGEFYRWTDSHGKERRAWLLNRLDSATSGVMLLATNEALARHIRILFKTKRIQKMYAALVFGRPAQKREVWRDKLAVHKKGGQIRTGGQGNSPAESEMRWVDTGPHATPPRSLIQLEPRTGRSHQLRVQCAQRHLPIVGDATYGDFRLNRELAKRTGEKRLCLHSFRTSFEYEWEGRRVRFHAEAPLPAEFETLLR
ncbi:MAG: RNA pseudouridine synthase [Candidatus Synoicihabitans palmerolidicus]|nr:RNA pseudouridine synthase [Candidatus Synoicihabitans palmerolidicus]